MIDPSELHASLRAFTGSERLYRHSLMRGFTYTQGVQHFAEHAGNGAYWLLDILATEPAIAKHFKQDRMAVVHLRVKDAKAHLKVDDGNDNLVYERDIDYTDCPDSPGSDGWTFYLCENHFPSGRIITMLLPSEY